MDPIAIIGIGCRFPGNANNPQDFWQLVSSGTDALTEILPNRFATNGLHALEPTTHGKIATPQGGFLERIDLFDPYFFGISPREARSMDPQQRLLLEIAWEALEDAGLVIDALAGSQTSVFIGAWTNDYEHSLYEVPSDIDLYMTTGGGRSSLSGRLSYTFDLRGPSLTIDTASSSSLVAVHLACQSLWNKECTLALAGGVNLILSPNITLAYSRSQMLSADGRCKFGDARADGYVRSEGAGVVILKPLAQALTDHDAIYAVIRGSAVSNDGRSGGSLVAPGVEGQIHTLQEAFRRANVLPAQLHYIEAHGTGTVLGDTVELKALGSILSEERAPEHPCIVGSVKTNIGHTEAAAGIASLIKVALSLKHKQIPPSLHFEQPNPQIPWHELPLIIPRTLSPWPLNTRPALAGVSSFGITGTNAHLVLQEAEVIIPVSSVQDNTKRAVRNSMLLPISARSEGALYDLARAYNSLLSTNTLALSDICYTASLRRSHHPYRLAVLGHSTAELSERLQSFVEHQPLPGVLSGQVPAGSLPRLVFVFPGQGSQWSGMGRQLLSQEPVFAASLLRCEQAFQPYVDWSLRAVLTQPNASTRLQDIDVIQPVLFAFQVSLAALWRSWGLIPAAVIGHSMGELAAAHVAGALSLSDAARVICQRSLLLRRIRGQGAMALVELSLQEAQEAISEQEAHLVSIAVSNSSRSTVLSGDPATLEAIGTRLERRGIFWGWVKVDVASHSPQVDPLCEDLLAAIVGIEPQRSSLPFYSTVTSRRCRGEELDAAYWVRNLREPVRFASVVQDILASGPTTFLEISPHPILLPAIEQELDHATNKGVILPSLKQNTEERATLFETISALYTRGYDIDWSQFFPAGGQSIALPIYPWQQQRYWFEQAAVRPGNIKKVLHSHFSAEASHPFLGQRLHAALKESVFETYFSAESPAYLNDHRIEGSREAPIVVPGSSHTSMALSAARAVFVSSACSLEEVFFLDALVFPEGDTRVIQVIISPQSTDKATFQIFSCEQQEQRKNESWLLHATGKIRIEQPDASFIENATLLRREIQTRCSETLNGADFYHTFREVGYHLGPTFCWIEQIWRGEGEALGKMRLPGEADHYDHYEIPPGLLDSCFQLLSLSIDTQPIRNLFAGDDIYVPVSIEQVKLSLSPSPSGQLWVHVHKREGNMAHKEVISGDIKLYNQDGRLCGEIIGLRVKLVSRRVLLRLIEQDSNNWLYELAWQPRPLLAPVHHQQPGAWLILSDRTGKGSRLVRSLQAQGERCIIIFAADSSLQISQDQWEIDVQHPEDIGALLQRIQEANALPLRGIVHLWSLDTLLSQEDLQTLTASSLLAAQNAICRSTLAIVQALSSLKKKTRLWLLTCGAQEVEESFQPRSVASGTLWGLGRTIANEYPELHCTLLDLDPEESENWLDDLLAEVQSEDAENQLALRKRKRYVARLVQSDVGLPPMPRGSEQGLEHPQRLEISERGILDHLVLRPMTRRPVGPHEVEIKVHATGLNFRDVLNALGMYPGDAKDFGGECAGTISAVGAMIKEFQIGDEVIAIFALEGSFSTFVTVRADFVVPKPEHLSFAEAITIPMTFLTAYYGLHHLAQMTAGERILIHTAAGGVGLAAIQLAQLAGAQVFATAHPEKQSFLREQGIHYIASSRSLDFANDLLRQSGGQGVDIVLNSLSGDSIAESLRLLTPHGRFIEIGKREIWSEQQVAEVRPDITYAIFDLVQIAQEQPAQIAFMLRMLLAMVNERKITPLPYKTFPLHNVVDAFRFMAQARHKGKIVVLHEESTSSLSTSVQPLFSESKSYLITGGLNGLGLATARWMTQHGARHLALVGRSHPTSQAQGELNALKDAGIRLHVLQGDVTQTEQMEQILVTIKQNMPPLRGIIHAAGVLDDGVLQHQTWDRFTRVLAPKLMGAWNLHTLTQDIPLDFFILFSSAASLLGSAGQSNHAAANAFLDGLALYRRSQNLPATSICWGGWSEIGAAAGADIARNIAFHGMESIAPSQGLQILGMVIARPITLLGVLPIKWSHYLEQLPAGQEPLLFTEFLQEARQRIHGKNVSLIEHSEFLRRLATTHPNQYYTLVLEHVCQQVRKIFRGDTSLPIDLQRSLREQGIDSLMSIELRNILRVTTGIPLPATLLFDYPDVEAISRHLTKLLSSNDVAVSPEQKGPQEKQALEEIEQLSDEEVDTLLEEMTRKVMKNKETGKD